MRQLVPTIPRFGVTPSLELEHEANRQFGEKTYYPVVDKTLREKPGAFGKRETATGATVRSDG